LTTQELKVVGEKDGMVSRQMNRKGAKANPPPKTQKDHQPGVTFVSAGLMLAALVVRRDEILVGVQF
jgi:hypothetical protein